MKIAKNLPEFIHYRNSLLTKSLAFIPTMGNLHAGHLSLISLGKSHAESTAASIFVNPAQFAPHEDFNKYPRTFDSDSKKLNDCKVDLLFAPLNTAELYPSSYLTRVCMSSIKNTGNPLRNDAGNINWLDEQPESIIRPGFFDGIATILTKLFNITRPNVVVFGQKDAIQCIVVKQLVRDLNFVNIKVVIGKIEREPDGLAMSSRNQYLSAIDRKAFGPILYGSLMKTRERCDLKNLKNNSDNVRNIVKGCYEDLEERFIRAMEVSRPENAGKYEVEYVTMCDNENGLVLGTMFGGKKREYNSGKNAIKSIEDVNISLVVRVNGTRLFDNVVIVKE